MESLRDYWNNRYREVSIQESGNRGFSLKYNKWYYKAKERVLLETLTRLGINITGKKVVDIGTGTGFFIDFFIRRKASYVLGVDISEKSIGYLKRKYASRSNVQLECLDVAKVFKISSERFDIVTVYDLMYLIVNETEFTKSLQNICAVVDASGYLFIVDMFPPSDIRLADYIVCRSINTYRNILSSLGCEIIDLVPQFFLFNRSGLRRLSVFLMNLFPSIVYFADRIALAVGISGDGNRSGASFRLLVAHRANEISL